MEREVVVHLAEEIKYCFAKEKKERKNNDGKLDYEDRIRRKE